MDSIVRLGCCVCVKEGLGATPAVVHHMIGRSGRRRGHLFTLPLCPGHHNSGLNNKTIVSRHPWRSAWECRYGTEEQLLEMVRELVRCSA